MEAKALRRKKEVKDLMRGFSSQYQRKGELTFLLQDWTDAYNVGGLLRVADALGIEQIYASGNTPVPPHPMISVTSMGAHRRVEVVHHAVHEEAAKAVLEDGWSLVAVELADRAVPYFDCSYPERTCLALGSEGAGLYKSVLKLCSQVVYVPMAGKGRSMNVHVTGAVVAFHALATLTEPLDGEGLESDSEG